MLALEEVRLTYNAGSSGEVRALRGVTLEIPAGQFVTVVGSNGAGKSSLMKVVAGEERPSSGRVRLAGRDVTRLPVHRRAGAVARVFDDPRAGTLPELSIEDNMALALSRGRRRTLRFASGRARRALMRERLAVLGLGLEQRVGDPAGLLSAGQRQSLTMVMAGLRDPRLLLLDEHLAALDPATQQRVLELTTGLVRRLGCATLMVTHNMEHAIAVGDRLLVMSRGQVVADLAGERKAALTPERLVETIVAAGDAVSDRLLLRETAAAGAA
jgi:putative ABC transport system ATP-binding protein